MFVSDVNIQPNHKRKPAMPPGSPLFGVPMYATVGSKQSSASRPQSGSGTTVLTNHYV